MEQQKEEDLCLLMDKLLIKSLELMERDQELGVEIDRLTADGKLDLAHTRFTKGPTAVSSVQLPTEDYKPFRALHTVTEQLHDDDDDGELPVPQLSLEKHPIEPEEDRIDPAAWFGILRPPTLNSARDKFARSLESIVERANVRITLANYLNVFAKLNKRKAEAS
uniref:Vacuolar ATPase assembly protein VMA22 n=2 Tax=Anopheles albimanus TaxID=7167 RepID=A0A182F890_ANOAL